MKQLHKLKKMQQKLSQIQIDTFLHGIQTNYFIKKLESKMPKYAQIMHFKNIAIFWVGKVLKASF